MGIIEGLRGRVLGLIEIRRRKLQFGLLTGAVALIAYLIIMVTGLGLGLSQRAGTALLNLEGDYLADASNANLSVIRSRLTDDDVAAIQSAPGVERAAPIGYVAAAIAYGAEDSDTAAVLGVVPGSFAEPEVASGTQLGGPQDLLIDRAWARLAGTEIGNRLALPVGFDTREFTVVGIVDQGYFFFQPAVYVELAAWQNIVYQGDDPSQRPAASVMLLQGDDLDSRSGERWEIVTKQAGFDSIEGVRAQQSTVDALRYVGLLIGAMVIGVFFYVLTLQKVALFGMLKAIGAPGTYLVTQMLLQVFIISAGGAALAMALALLTEATLLSSDAVPIVFTTGAIATTMISVIVAGVAGAALSARQVTSIDPIIAMQQQ